MNDIIAWIWTNLPNIITYIITSIIIPLAGIYIAYLKLKSDAKKQDTDNKKTAADAEKIKTEADGTFVDNTGKIIGYQAEYIDRQKKEYDELQKKFDEYVLETNKKIESNKLNLELCQEQANLNQIDQREFGKMKNYIVVLTKAYTYLAGIVAKTNPIEVEIANKMLEEFGVANA